MLWPAKPTPIIRIASPEEFANFVDETTSLYVMSTASNPPGEEGKEHEPEKSAKIIPVPRRLRRWIQKHCPDLLREIGRPSKLEPFTIDTGDAKPINIRPRAHSPLDLQKIKEFIDENLKNG